MIGCLVHNNYNTIKYVHKVTQQNQSVAIKLGMNGYPWVVVKKGAQGGASGMWGMFYFRLDLDAVYTPECLLCGTLFELCICDLCGFPAYAVYLHKKFSKYQIKWGRPHWPLWGWADGGGQEENQGWGQGGQG